MPSALLETRAFAPTLDTQSAFISGLNDTLPPDYYMYTRAEVKVLLFLLYSVVFVSCIVGT